VRPRLVRVLQASASAALAAVLTLPLVSLAVHAGEAWVTALLVAALAILAVVDPALGFLGLIVTLPLALAVTALAGLPPAEGVTDALLLACAAGALCHAIWRPPDRRTRLALPALLLGTFVAASAVVDLAVQIGAAPPGAFAALVWRHVTADYVLTAHPFEPLHGSLRWIAGLVIAVAGARAIGRRPRLAAAAVRLWLIGAAAAASFAVMRLAQILLEGKVDADPWRAFVYVLTHVRMSAVHPDPNAAASYFAIALAAAVVVGVARRAVWVVLGVWPFVLLAFGLAQSRAAIGAVTLVLGAVAVVPAFRRRQWVRVGAVVAAVAAVAIGSLRLTDRSHVSVGVAGNIRGEMARVALRISAAHPWFGVGLGRFASTSRAFITTDEPVIHAFTERHDAGENAHNSVLQILAELGAPACAVFFWLVVPPAWPWPRVRPPGGLDVERLAISAGLAAFLTSALFGHPLLIGQVAAAFFVVVGLSDGLSAPPAGPPRRVVHVAAWVAIGLVVISLPWRVSEALGPAAGDGTRGVGAPAGVIGDVAYRPVSREASWTIDGDARGLSLPLRWAADGAADCRVAVTFDGAAADEISLSASAWHRLAFAIITTLDGHAPHVLAVRVSDDRCHLLAGDLAVRR
jgi:O-antigen ligase